MYPRFLQIIIGIETQNRTHRPVLELSAKLFASMKTGFTRVHRPLLPAMLPIGNEDAGHATDGVNSPVPDAAGADAPGSADAGTTNAADASASAAADIGTSVPTNASTSVPADVGTSNAPDVSTPVVTGVTAEDQPLPSPRPNTPNEEPNNFAGINIGVSS